MFCDGIVNLVAGFEGAGSVPVAYDTVAELAGAGYADGTNIIGDPMFVDEAGLDFYIQLGSAAVDAGEDMTGIVDDDIDGQSRPSSVYA